MEPSIQSEKKSFMVVPPYVFSYPEQALCQSTCESVFGRLGRGEGSFDHKRRVVLSSEVVQIPQLSSGCNELSWGMLHLGKTHFLETIRYAACH